MPHVIPEDLSRKLKSFAAAQDRDVEVVLREAIEDWMSRENGKQVGRTPLGRQLRAIREEYIRSGGKLLSMEEIDREIADRRGERYPEE